MSVWFCIPSVRAVADADRVLAEWRFRGYNVAVYRNDQAADIPSANRNIHGPYTGYAASVNLLAKLVLRDDPAAEWIVTGGDDVLPAPEKDADTIARECTTYFGGTLGVMQPTGDRHLEDARGKCSAERVCVSPWMGRAWCERAYMGNGPMWAGYFHFFVDEDLHCVAKRHGVLWHRRDLTQHHEYWGRTAGGRRPDHLLMAQEKWALGRQIFEQRKAANFPESGLK